MGLLRTFVCTPTFSVDREEVTYTTAVDFDNATQHLFNRAQRPVYKFELNLEPMLRYAGQDLSAFHAFHQGGKSFMFSGMKFGAIEDYHLFAEGDGAQTQFFLPNRYIGAGSFSIQTRNQVTLATSVWLTSAYSVTLTPGIVTFGATIPSSGHDIEAKYACQYRCVFEPDGFKISEFTYNVYRSASLKLREVLIYT